MACASNRTRPVLPFLKWAGGKRWLAPAVQRLLPKTYGRYIEPFLGSGAVYFAANPVSAVLSDLNGALIETYETVRQSPLQVWDELAIHSFEHSKDYYYSIRGARPSSPIERAANFIYLNRTCWNGLYRVNRSGTFNVPIGTKTQVLFPTDDPLSVSIRLRSASLSCQDFECVIDRAEADDFIFADPPYTLSEDDGAFLKYNDRVFSWQDQQRLAAALARAQQRGAHIVMANADNAEIRKLYKHPFRLRRLARASVLAASATHRTKVTELLVVCLPSHGAR
ncbi:MAG: Dam family site-specific DNA-(adenine-N6)-methyltransferase [Proteobacteria bacterium]|nr:Dam family site-specific DNA-(adenine-N6)-methyltransferase [Pseudomonadota bacterium]